jgi:hypothetical protein
MPISNFALTLDPWPNLLARLPCFNF